MFSTLFSSRGELPPPGHGIAKRFVRWTCARSFLHRGYWLIASLYLVFDAELSAFQLIFIGTAQGMISLVSEVPAGVLSDTISRKWAIVVSQIVIGVSMVATAMTTDFALLVATQMLWGIGWTFVSGADVAWATDELDDAARISPLLVRRARWEQVGALAGMAGIGGLAWLGGRQLAMFAAGAAMVCLGLYVARRFPERNFAPIKTRRASAFKAVVQRGAALSRRDHQILLILTATFLVNGAAEAFGRLYPKRLAEIGFPSDSSGIVWFTMIGVACLLVSIAALRLVEIRIEGGKAAPLMYALACLGGTMGLVLLALAPNAVAAIVGILVVEGMALSVTRAVGVIWVNQRAMSDVRATVHSFLAQAEYLGEICCGFGLALVARSANVSTAFMGASLILGLTAVLIFGSSRRSTPERKLRTQSGF